MKKILMFIGATVLLIAVYSFYSQQQIKSVADTLVQSLLNSDSAAAYSTLSSDFQDLISEEDFSRKMSRSDFTAYTKASWENWEIDIINGHGHVAGNLMDDQGPSVPIAIDLVKQYGKWKVVKVFIAKPN